MPRRPSRGTPESSRTRSLVRAACILLAALPLPLAILATGPQPTVNYATDVAPVLKARCASCHTGADAPAGLVITDPKCLAKVITPGKPDQSILVQRLLGTNGLQRMPIGFAPISDDNIAKIKAWIVAGAKMDGPSGPHWAYVAVKSPPIPRVSNPKWIRNPIDTFILARLDKEGLKPSPEAGKETLIRRLCLDLTGLPPSPQETDSFLADKRPDAYERVVDRLLASPHYGEKMAQRWLDLARYADTDGYEKDLDRTAWLYRDWVINAFNRDQPYDKFVIDQIAGDLEPNPTTDQLVATGFNRNTMMNLEGGVDQAEAHFDVVLDRVSTTGTVFLGSTIGCARCHDHKYDPFTQKDFYAMAGFYDNAVIEPQGDKNVGEEKWYEPFMPVPSAAQIAEKDRLSKKLAADQVALKSKSDELSGERTRWLQEVAAFSPVTLEGEVQTPVGTKAVKLTDGSIRIEGDRPMRAVYEISGTLPEGEWTGLQLEALPDSQLPGAGPGRSDSGNFVLAKLETFIGNQPLKFGHSQADFAQEGFPIEGVLDDNADSGWAIAPETGKPHEAIFSGSIVSKGTTAFKIRLIMKSRYSQHTLGRFRLSLTREKDPERFAIPMAIRQAIASNPNSQAVTDFYASISPTLRPLKDEVSRDQTALDKLKGEIPYAMVMRDKPGVPVLKSWVRIHGEFLSKGAEVDACTPKFLNPMPQGIPNNRLALADWIADTKNPLTARVEVNRLWEQVFGRGIVETDEDFGTQGSPPTHRELLDWLASEFMSRHWDVKAMLRLIVTSSTYRQASNSTPALEAKDPQNLLLARGPRYRLDAETIRDVALSAGGLLDPKIGGPSVFPIQPEGIWNSPYSGQRWMTSKGGDRYRRGLYTFWKRTAPYPEFLAFDATSREECTARRIRTNTPLQALAMLNDDALMDAARGLAKRMLGAGPTDLARLTFGFRCAVGRRPSNSELARLQALLRDLRGKYAAKLEEAKKLKATPEEAAWVMTANVLLNLDETIERE